MDANGDGFGDFVGLTDRLDYLASLGVTCLWLLPFYPSPDRDNGYDISDYYNVNPRSGTLGDIAFFFREAESRGIRVILDLVIQHTSEEHPWFRSARNGSGLSLPGLLHLARRTTSQGTAQPDRPHRQREGSIALDLR
ncbi:MAG: alpha-amylase family glycosyl hydrolase [Thermomicrobiales bacterium]